MMQADEQKERPEQPSSNAQPTYLSAKEYQAVAHYLEVLTTLTQDLPLEAAIRTAKRANNLGPLLHPELHVTMQSKVENQIALMESLLWFQNEIYNQTQAQLGED